MKVTTSGEEGRGGLSGTPKKKKGDEKTHDEVIPAK